MEVCPPQLPQRLLLLGAAALTASALHTADLVDLCGRTRQADGLLLRSHSASRRFYFVAPDTDCGLWVRAAAPGDRIRLQFRFFLVYSLTPPSVPPLALNASAPPPADPCAPGSYLQLYEGPPGTPRPLGAPLCGLTIPAPVTTSGDLLGLRLVTRGRQPRVDFVGEVTSFRLGSCGAYFPCRNGRCIPLSLVCDRWGMDNCGDGSDQASWPPANCGGPSPVPSLVGNLDDGNSQTLTPYPALQSSGPLGTAAEMSLPAPWDPAQQGVALEGPWLQGVALASSLSLASAALLLGLLWCCCFSGQLASRARARGLCCTVCYRCPGQVAPGGLRLSEPAFQHQGVHS
ncbi:low-density lipoprotein receptor class A domain-containing protein 2 [Cervus elaphus]|uniref:low-density lipoprotein receptor class A domain-containing protein 2 n=1 Tax=Cervus canadensis TaxID=1574408 RepID=UPI001CA37FBA|nr:low-density lipoprotein receptor class A domain-containing protein 2 [Cervus canadensis]XP_043766492.1 low-density lipoprotein receptor class A domain-containing protein 2 [Cervus elaphus]